MRTIIAFILVMLLAPVALSGQDWVGRGQEGLSFKRLASTTDFRGYQCAAGAAWFYSGGQLRSCEVARNTRFGEAIVPQGSYIYLAENGLPAYAFLSRDAEIQGHACRGVSHDLMTSFFPDGHLRLCWLAVDEEIQGVPCAKTTFVGKLLNGDNVATFFYQNGALKSCRVSREVTIQGEKFKRGDYVFLDEQGRPANVT